MPNIFRKRVLDKFAKQVFELEALSSFNPAKKQEFLDRHRYTL